jgi:hypothetical protein
MKKTKSRPKKIKKENLSPDKIIIRVADYIPDFYRSNHQFIKCLEFIRDSDWESALQCLIKLTQEYDHYFSEDFWNGLAMIAEKFNLSQQADYCKTQIEKNATDVKFETPFGWTTVKIDNNRFEHKISSKITDDWTKKRHKRDNVEELIKTDGIYLKEDGRSGYVYYVENHKIAEVSYELDMNGYYYYFDSLNYWVYPSRIPLTEDEKSTIKKAILGQSGTNSSFH